jgi:hypothetical protein
MIQLKVALNTKKQPTNPSFLDYDITGFFKMSSGMGATSGAGRLVTTTCKQSCLYTQNIHWIKILIINLTT